MILIFGGKEKRLKELAEEWDFGRILPNPDPEAMRNSLNEIFRIISVKEK